jgi:Xaa-Pro aminopeptidase
MTTMLTESGCQQRRQRLWDAFEIKPELILIVNPKHLFYFANYVQSPFIFRSNDAGAALLLHADGNAILIADSMSKGFAETAHVDETVLPVWYDGHHSAPQREAFLVDNVLKEIGKNKWRQLGLEFSAVPAGILAGLGSIQTTNIDSIILDLKRSKDADELILLNRSMLAGQAGMAAALTGVKPGMSELEIYFLVQDAALTAIGTQAVVYGDFVTGPRTETVGGPPSERRVQAGELVLLDFSTVIGQYRGDFANTHICAGKPTPKHLEMYSACLEAMSAGENQLNAGTPAKEVYRAVHQAFVERKLADYFPHHAGHGIGLGHPEAPFLVSESSDTLVAGDVVTLEPGLYIKGLCGMRYERNYLITASGYELLSKHRLTLEPS